MVRLRGVPPVRAATQEVRVSDTTTASKIAQASICTGTRTVIRSGISDPSMNAIPEVSPAQRGCHEGVGEEI